MDANEVGPSSFRQYGSLSSSGNNGEERYETQCTLGASSRNGVARNSQWRWFRVENAEIKTSTGRMLGGGVPTPTRRATVPTFHNIFL